MRDLFQKLLPYCLRHKRAYLLGIAVVLLTNVLYARIPVLVGRAVDYLLSPQMTARGLGAALLHILAFVAVGAVAQYFQRIYLIATSWKIEGQFRNDFFRHLTSLAPAFYDHIRTGDVFARATSDVDQVRMVLGPGIMYPISACTVVPITLYLMMSSSWPVALACLGPLLVMPFLVNLLANMTYRRSLKLQEHFSEFSGRIQESISGARVVKAFVQEEHELDTLDRLNRRNADLNMSLARVQAAFHPFFISIMIFGTLTVIWTSSHFITSDPALLKSDPRMMTKGDLLAFVMLFRNLFWPIMGLGWVISVYQRGAASMHRIRLLWDQQPAIRDTADTDTSLRTVRGEVEFRDLDFTYPGAERPALRGLSLRIPAGRSLGIVGSVGSGKSTLAHLISRLYDPPAGKVFVDGRDVRDFPLEVLRGAIGTVFQETYLFSDTIEENICFGARERKSEELARRCARIAAVDADIEGFPRQYQTVLGERGVNLSGGQKQRVALARAVAADPRILVLDDAFASVDTHTEEQILQGLRGVLEDRTTILISHRISTVQSCDEILVLEDGRAAERGTHAELVAAGGLYAEIHRRQLLEESIAGEE